MGKLLWEAIQRSTTGQLMSEDEFETELFRPCSSISRRSTGSSGIPTSRA